MAKKATKAVKKIVKRLPSKDASGQVVVDVLKKEAERMKTMPEDFDTLGQAHRTTVGDVDVLVAFDPLYHTILVYAYGPYSLWKELSAKLFKTEGKPMGPASALCAFGSAKEEFGKHVLSLVWVNKEVPLKLSAASWIHEIVHVSQDVLRHVGISDDSGEAQAYFVGREAARVLKAFLGLGSENNTVPADLGKLCGVVDNIVNTCSSKKGAM